MGIDMNKLNQAIEAAKVDLDDAILKSFLKIILEVDRAIVLATPVKEGHARRNWLPSINSARGDVVDEEDKTGAKAIAECTAATSQVEIGDSFFLTNNVHYIQYLDEGSSAQAPAGFVEKAVQAAKAGV